MKKSLSGESFTEEKVTLAIVGKFFYLIEEFGFESCGLTFETALDTINLKCFEIVCKVKKYIFRFS